MVDNGIPPKLTTSGNIPPLFDDRKHNDNDGEGKRHDDGETYELEDGRDDQAKDGK